MNANKYCHGCMEEKIKDTKCPHCGWVEGSAPESALHMPPGTILQEKYLIGRALSQGGFGITYLAWDLNLNLIIYDQALDIFMPVLGALKEVHAAGILHRDISPDKLLIEISGQEALLD